MPLKIYKYDLHIHTNSSFDSDSSIREIIQRAKSLDLNGIALTDHNVLFSPIKAKKKEKESGLHIIPGEEILTEYGEIIGLYMQEQIINNSFIEVIEALNDQGAIIVLPHPFRCHLKISYLASKVHAIEIINNKSRITQNLSAKRLCKKYNKAGVAGSDAHTINEIGKAITLLLGNDEESFRKAIKKKDIKVQGYSNSIYTTFKQVKKKVGF